MNHPLCLYSATVRQEWLDVNKHMNTAYYALVFDQAAEAFMAHLGIDNDYIATRDASWVALESHTRFDRELRLDDPLRVCAQILDSDAKRIHLFQTLLHAGEGYQAACNELMIMHLDLRQRRPSTFPDEVADKLQGIATNHQELPQPPEQGSLIGIRRAPR